MDEVAASKAAARGAQAEELLRSELLQEAFKLLHDEYVNAWKITHFKEHEGRERLWLAVNIIGKVKDHLTKIARDGRVSSRDLAAIRAPKQ